MVGQRRGFVERKGHLIYCKMLHTIGENHEQQRRKNPRAIRG